MTTTTYRTNAVSLTPAGHQCGRLSGHSLDEVDRYLLVHTGGLNNRRNDTVTLLRDFTDYGAAVEAKASLVERTGSVRYRVLSVYRDGCDSF